MDTTFCTTGNMHHARIRHLIRSISTICQQNISHGNQCDRPKRVLVGSSKMRLVRLRLVRLVNV